jgi:hypothetical protein
MGYVLGDFFNPHLVTLLVKKSVGEAMFPEIQVK